MNCWHRIVRMLIEEEVCVQHSKNTLSEPLHSCNNKNTSPLHLSYKENVH